MNRLASLPLLVLFTLAITAPVSMATAFEPPPDAVVKKLTAAIRAVCPEVQFEAEPGEKFVARHGTLTYTIHNRSKTGEVFPQTHQVEGPNYRGFLLVVWQETGPYEGAAAVPQTLEGPYFPTFIDAVPTPDGRGHRRVSFSYGRQIDAKLKQAILAALAETGFVSEPSK